MGNRILTDTGWEKRIRGKLGVDPAYLPDEVIQQPDIIDIAEANIISQIPDYDILDGDLRTYLETAVVLECCILLCPSMSTRLPKKEAGPHISYEQGTDWSKKKAEFIDERNSYIGKILEIAFPEAISPTLSRFTVTYPKRK